MSKALARLLDQPERAVAKAIDKLEAAKGYPSEDVRLLAESSLVVRKKLNDLGLDPEDTTGEELYHALLAKFERDSGSVDKAVGIDNRSPLDERLKRAVVLTKSAAPGNDIWVLKHSSARKLLRAQPPKKLMKQLSYRSLDSLLKRESIAEIYLALAFAESQTWQKVFNKLAGQLNTTDYELRPPEYISMATPQWAKVQTPVAAVTADALIGAIGLWPSATSQKAPVLTLALLLLDGLEEIEQTEFSGSIAHLNPALLWWEDAKHLMAVCNDETVSMNYKDVALNHLSSFSYQARLANHGQQSLWSELTSRYRAQKVELEESLTNLETQASESLNKLADTPAPARLAVEYEKAIADEF